MHDPQVIAETPWFSMRKVGIDVAPGERRDFYSIHYPRPAVGIVAIQDEKVLLIRHYRYPIDKVVWAIPSGGVDEGEDPAVAALRELREETGWQAQRVEEIIRFNPLLRQAAISCLSPGWPPVSLGGDGCRSG